MKPRIVLSGVNFIEAGPLSIFKDALQELVCHFADRYEIIAIVHSRELINLDGLTYVELPHVKSSWLRRIRFEYWDCRVLSRNLRPSLWLCMHDMTSNVTATTRAVYCHNPAPFCDLALHDALLDWKFTCFRIFYRFLYAINLQQNQFVVVQQEWMRKEFHKRYRISNIVVAYPSIPPLMLSTLPYARSNSDTPCCFFYPAYSRIFKNFEVVLEATRILEERGITDFEVWLTISGGENAYAARLFSAYGWLRSIRWLGTLPRDGVVDLYGKANCLLFPSKLETWGMPISEFKQTGKPMLVADLPYARETVGPYNAARFFPPDKPQRLAEDMEAFLHGTLEFSPTVPVSVPSPYAQNWVQLFRILLNEFPDAR